MKDQTKKWLEYADENLQSAKVLLESELFNPCLQNVQQSVEKMLKAVLVELGIKITQTDRFECVGIFKFLFYRYLTKVVILSET